MKTKLTLVTLIACAAAGTAFAADPVVAFRASSGTTTNSADTIYVGNTDWGSDSKEIGEKYFKDLSLSHGGTSFTWDEDKKAFYNGFENRSFDTIFALTGTASFVNESNTLAVFRYAGDKKERDMGYENTILFADSSKFENRGECLMEFEVSDAWSAPRFVTWLRDDAVAAKSEFATRTTLQTTNWIFSAFIFMKIRRSKTRERCGLTSRNLPKTGVS